MIRSTLLVRQNRARLGFWVSAVLTGLGLIPTLFLTEFISTRLLDSQSAWATFFPMLGLLGYELLSVLIIMLAGGMPRKLGTVLGRMAKALVVLGGIGVISLCASLCAIITLASQGSDMAVPVCMGGLLLGHIAICWRLGKDQAQMLKGEASSVPVAPLIAPEEWAELERKYGGLDPTAALQHLRQADGLRTFRGVREWIELAQQHMASLTAAGQRVATAAQEVQQRIIQYQEKRKTAFFLIRPFVIYREEEYLEVQTQKLGMVAKRYFSIAEDLHRAQENLPVTAEDRDRRIKALRHERATLSIELREEETCIREIRAHARRRAASYIPIGPTYPGEREYVRGMMRQEKEQAIAPHEDRVLTIKDRISWLDRQILWLQQFEE